MSDMGLTRVEVNGPPHAEVTSDGGVVLHLDVVLYGEPPRYEFGGWRRRASLILTDDQIAALTRGMPASR